MSDPFLLQLCDFAHLYGGCTNTADLALVDLVIIVYYAVLLLYIVGNIALKFNVKKLSFVSGIWWKDQAVVLVSSLLTASFKIAYHASLRSRLQNPSADTEALAGMLRASTLLFYLYWNFSQLSIVWNSTMILSQADKVLKAPGQQELVQFSQSLLYVGIAICGFAGIAATLDIVFLCLLLIQGPTSLVLYTRWRTSLYLVNPCFNAIVSSFYFILSPKKANQQLRDVLALHKKHAKELLRAHEWNSFMMSLVRVALPVVGVYLSTITWANLVFQDNHRALLVCKITIEVLQACNDTCFAIVGRICEHLALRGPKSRKPLPVELPKPSPQFSPSISVPTTPLEENGPFAVVDAHREATTVKLDAAADTCMVQSHIR
ncbi:hypothetical protein HDU91_006265 [Kappamyces sp. JEL0680]|nr:hypothetical protein HDU91_006265 [Kappamyces sp. JEL0680]